MNPSVAVVSKFDRQGAERKRGYGVNASPLSEGCRFERAHPACCVPFDSAGLKTTEQFPFPVECRLVARSCRSGMSAVWSLSRGKRTWRGQPISVEIDPTETLAAPNSRCSRCGFCPIKVIVLAGKMPSPELGVGHAAPPFQIGRAHV